MTDSVRALRTGQSTLFNAVVEHGLAGIVAKRHRGLYRRVRGRTKVKNPGYWRRESEIAQMQRSRDRRARVTVVWGRPAPELWLTFETQPARRRSCEE